MAMFDPDGYVLTDARVPENTMTSETRCVLNNAYILWKSNIIHNNVFMSDSGSVSLFSVALEAQHTAMGMLEPNTTCSQTNPKHHVAENALEEELRCPNHK